MARKKRLSIFLLRYNDRIKKTKIFC